MKKYLDIISYDTVIFDFDGVIVDSNNLKLRAMKETLQIYDKNIVDEFLNDFKGNFGTQRKEHFVNFYYNYLCNSNFFEVFFDVHEKKYSRHVTEYYRGVSLTTGIINLLQCLYKNSIPCHIVTAGDVKQVNEVLKKKSLEKFFLSTTGTPKSKVENINKIFSTFKNKGSMLFIGDALADLKAAMELDIDFLFVDRYSFSSREILQSKQNFYSTNTLDIGDLNNAVMQ